MDKMDKSRLPTKARRIGRSMNKYVQQQTGLHNACKKKKRFPYLLVWLPNLSCWVMNTKNMQVLYLSNTM